MIASFRQRPASAPFAKIDGQSTGNWAWVKFMTARESKVDKGRARHIPHTHLYTGFTEENRKRVPAGKNVEEGIENSNRRKTTILCSPLMV